MTTTENTTQDFTGQTQHGHGCACGCGLPTGKSLYRPGHDAKHVSVLVADFFANRESWRSTEDQFVQELLGRRDHLTSYALKNKFIAAVNRRTYKEFDRWANQINRAKGNPEREAKIVAPFEFHPDDAWAHVSSKNTVYVARESETTELPKVTAVEDLEPVKVGRWTYPARKRIYTDGAEVVERNQKRDGSGEWLVML